MPPPSWGMASGIFGRAEGLHALQGRLQVRTQGFKGGDRRTGPRGVRQDAPCGIYISSWHGRVERETLVDAYRAHHRTPLGLTSQPHGVVSTMGSQKSTFLQVQRVFPSIVEDSSAYPMLPSIVCGARRGLKGTHEGGRQVVCLAHLPWTAQIPPAVAP